jgi:hypothetical protein
MAEFLAQAREEAGGIGKQMAGVKNFGGNVGQAQGRLDELRARAEAYPHLVAAAGSRFAKEVSNLRGESDALVKHAVSLDARLAPMLASTKALGGVHAFLLELARRASKLQADVAAANHLEADVEVPAGRLQELVDHFTVLSHKAIGAAATQQDAEAGDAGGTLTLF